MSSDNYRGDPNDGGPLDSDDWTSYVPYSMHEATRERVEDGEEHDQEYYDEILREEMAEHERLHASGDAEGLEFEVVLEQVPVGNEDDEDEEDEEEEEDDDDNQATAEEREGGQLLRRIVRLVGNGEC